MISYACRIQIAEAFVAAFLLASPTGASASLAVRPIILDLPADSPQRGDMEIINQGAETLYVVIEPARIDKPGTPQETRTPAIDPAASGLLVTPTKLVLEPGQRKFARVVMLSPPGERDRIFRVAVKPIIGGVDGKRSGVKVMVGFDALVIQRPTNAQATVEGRRSGNRLILSNRGNTNAELYGGKVCETLGGPCTSLDGLRLYPGNERIVNLPVGGSVTYLVKIGGLVRRQTF